MRNTPHHTPSFEKLRLANTDLEREKARAVPYMQLVGSLLYVAVQTRPDVLYQVATLARFMSDPTVEAYAAAEQILLYLAKTQDLSLEFKREAEHGNNVSRYAGLEKYTDEINRNFGFVAYSDASWGKANPFYGYTLFMCGGPVSFASKTLKNAESTAEAEYAAAYQATRDIMFVRGLCEDLGYPLHGELILGVDNEAAIKIANNAGVTAS